MKKRSLSLSSLIFILFITSITNSLSEVKKIIKGTAKVIDGDTIKINGKKIRLFGIDAPEKNQICSKNSNSYNCGLTSTKFLKEIIKNEKIECTYKNLDRYGRILGICGDINGKMVEFGHAVAYVRYSKKYLSLQRKAKNEKRGIWSGKFDMPEDWRRKNK